MSSLSLGGAEKVMTEIANRLSLEKNYKAEFIIIKKRKNRIQIKKQYRKNLLKI